MRRMYSEQELTKIIGDVLDREIESGAFDEKVSDAVDAYLVENPVDITALAGKDVSLKTLTSTGDVSVGKDLAVVGNITGASIIEIMSGYYWIKGSSSLNETYVGIAKNGNKITFVVFGEITKTENTPSGELFIGQFLVPNSVYSKFYPFTLGDLATFMDVKVISFFSSKTNHVDIPCSARHPNNTNQFNLYISSLANLEVGTKYVFRYEVTLLLSDNLIAE